MIQYNILFQIQITEKEKTHQYRNIVYFLYDTVTRLVLNCQNTCDISECDTQNENGSIMRFFVK